jgi:hypothetical protein
MVELKLIGDYTLTVKIISQKRLFGCVDENLVRDIIFHFSYCHIVNYIPRTYLLLSERIMMEHLSRIEHVDKALSAHIINMFVKLGFILLAKDLIQQINGRSPDASIRIYVEYHLYNFVYNTKALLDAIAVTLNHVYELGFIKGEIDLKRNRFVDKLEAKSSVPLLIVKELRRKRAWILEVVEWRELLIHRCVTRIAPYGDPDYTNDYTVKMPVKPASLFGFNELGLPAKAQFEDIQPFCDRWITMGKSLVEKLGDDLLVRYPQ